MWSMERQEVTDRYLQHITSDYPNTHWDTLGIRFPTGRCAEAMIYCSECDWNMERPQRHWFGTDLLNDTCLVCGYKRGERE
jgi:hypothetical protein